MRFVKKSISIWLITVFILMPFGSEVLAKDPLPGKEISTEKMALDLILVRPAGILAMVFGTAVAVVGTPFSLLGGNTKDSYEKLVVAPTRYTFKRQLGDL